MVFNHFAAHPWHGVALHADSPKLVNAYIELVPTDVVKYELDKQSGLLKVDRPQKFSSQCPTLYGFIPRTYCDKNVAACAPAGKGQATKGDHDPLDICVLADRPMPHGGFLLTAVPIGGLRLLDRGEADDKIVAVLSQDPVFGHWREISDCPKTLLDRLTHYFLTYKQMPGDQHSTVEISEIYGAADAQRVIDASVLDYRALI